VKHIDRSFIVVSGILIALAGTAVPALAVTSINSCPANITAGGDYQLTADLGCTITISASGVSLKLNGHSITPTSGNDGIDVTGAGRLNHVGIQGPGLIKGIGNGAIGINIGNVDYSQVGLVTIKGFLAGIAVAAANTQSSTFLTIASNVIGQSSGIGIFLNNCTSCAVSGNDVSGIGGTNPSTDTNPGVGIAVQGGGGGNTVNNNVSNGNVYAGIGIGGGTGNRVYGNTTNGNGAYGIGVGGSGTQVFSNTSSQANGIADLLDESATCSGHVWGNNVFQTSAFGPQGAPTIPSPCIH
jgi:Right handed beta helix region